jgi:hypothetical protein
MTGPPVGVITGTIGELRCGFQVAARFTTWKISFQQATIGLLTVACEGRVTEVNDFYSTQRPLDLWVWMGEAWWVWKDVNVAGEIGQKQNFALSTRGNPEARR